MDSQSEGPSLVSVWALRSLDVQSIYGALIRVWGPRWPGWTIDLWDTQSPAAWPSTITCDS